MELGNDYKSQNICQLTVRTSSQSHPEQDKSHNMVTPSNRQSYIPTYWHFSLYVLEVRPKILQFQSSGMGGGAS